MQIENQILGIIIGASIAFIGTILSVIINRRAEISKERRAFLRQKATELYLQISREHSFFLQVPLDLMGRIAGLFDGKKETSNRESMQEEIMATIELFFPQLKDEYLSLKSHYTALVHAGISIVKLTRQEDNENLDGEESNSLESEKMKLFEQYNDEMSAILDPMSAAKDRLIQSLIREFKKI